MRPRMYGSTLMNTLHTSSSSSRGSGSSRTASSKSSSTGSPTGRRARRISRVVVGIPKDCRVRAMELEGRHIVVTGAASGIGLACATRFEEEGAKVTRADLNASGDTVQVDVGHRDQIEALIATAETRHGDIDLFFSNAGITGAGGGPPDLTDDDWDLLHRVNVMSHVWAARVL